MAANVDEILPKASDVMMRIAEAQAEKAAARDRQKAAEHAEKVKQWELTAFKNADANGDGALTKEELGKAPGNRLLLMRAHFDEMDTNHDGKVSLEEQDAWAQAQMKAEFEAMDTNHDGKISPEEREAWQKKQRYMQGK